MQIPHLNIKSFQLLKFSALFLFYVLLNSVFNLEGYLSIPSEELESYFPNHHMFFAFIYPGLTVLFTLITLYFILIIKRTTLSFVLFSREFVFFVLLLFYPFHKFVVKPIDAFLVILLILILYIPQSFYSLLLSSAFKLWKDKKLVTILLLTAIVRTVALFTTDNYANGDATARLWQSWDWAGIDYLSIKNIYRFIMPNVDWLPLQHYFSGLSYYLTNDLVYAPRITMAVVGVLTILPLYKLSELLFNRKAALLACFIYAFYTSAIQINILTLSETLYIFSLLYGLYFLILFQQNSKPSALRNSCIFLAIGCMLRYEAWVILALVIFALFLFFEKNQRHWRYLAIPFSVFFFYLLLVYLRDAHPFRGVMYSDVENIEAFNLSGREYSRVFVGFLRALILGANLALIIAWFKFKRQKKSIQIFLFVSTILFLVFLYKLMSFTLHPQNRYFTIYMVLFTPLLANEITSRVRQTSLQYTLALLFLLPNFYLMKSVFWDEGRLHFTEGFKHSYSYVNHNITQGRFIVDQEMGADNPNQAWLAYAGLSLLNDSHDKTCTYRVSYEHWKNDYATLEKFETALSQSTYLVLFKNGELQSQLLFSKDTESYKEYTFIKEFELEGNYIYEISTN